MHSHLPQSERTLKAFFHRQDSVTGQEVLCQGVRISLEAQNRLDLDISVARRVGVGEQADGGTVSVSSSCSGCWEPMPFFPFVLCCVLCLPNLVDHPYWKA